MSLNKPSWMNSDTWSQFIAKWSNSPLCRHEGCNKPADTIDHIVARRNGGPDEIENLQPLCREHNSKKGIKPDEYWSKTFFFDHPKINLDKLRTAQKREGWDRILDYQDWFLHPWNQINRTIYGNFWIVGAGKTLAPVVQACALNYIIQKQLGKSYPRINRILILTKEQAIRNQIANSLRSSEEGGDNELVKYGISSDAPTVGIIEEGYQIQDFPSLELCNIWVACIHQFFETNKNPKENLSEILAQFPFIAVDEPHYALHQVLNIVQKAVDSLVFGYTGTPIEADGKALSQFTLLSVYDYDDANENDHSMKYVSDKDGEFTYFVEEVGITKAELINDLGFQETDDATQKGYDKNLIPQLSVVQAVLNYMEICDKDTIGEKTLVISDIAPHRPEGSKAELWYPVHSMIVVDSVQIGLKICEQINQIFERNRKRYSKEKGYQAEIIHSNLSEDKSLKKAEKDYFKGKKMSPKHPWMLYQQTGMLNEKCSRVLVVIGMAREGVSNRYCGCIGYACKSESLVELIQRAIGRQIRSFDKIEQLKKQFKPGETNLDQECITLLTPHKRLDSVKIITHETYNNANDIRRAISYICNMRDHLESIPTIEQLMEGQVTPGIDIPVQGILKTKEKIEIAGDIGKSKKVNPELPINTGNYQDSWGENNETKRKKVSEWVQKVVDSPEDAEREINYTGMLPEIPVVWDETLDSQPTKDQLIQYIKTHHPDFIPELNNPDSQKFLERFYKMWVQDFDIGHIPNISKLSDIRTSLGSQVINSLGQYLQLSDKNIVYSLVGSAMKQVLGTNESLTDKSRYNCPQAQAILTRKDVTQKIKGWVRNKLIAKGYCPELAIAFEIEQEEN